METGKTVKVHLQSKLSSLDVNHIELTKPALHRRKTELYGDDVSGTHVPKNMEHIPFQRCCRALTRSS